MLVQLQTLGGLCRSKVREWPNRPGDILYVAVAPDLITGINQDGEVPLLRPTRIEFKWSGQAKLFKKYNQPVYIYEERR